MRKAESDILPEPLKKMEEETGKEAKIQVFSLAEWRKLAEKKDNFAIAVLKNSLLLSGDQL